MQERMGMLDVPVLLFDIFFFWRPQLKMETKESESTC